MISMYHKNPVSSDHNKNSVSLICEHFSNLEHFVFYGTLLGFVREGKPIEGDDDVDILVNKKHFNEVKALVKTMNFSIHDGEFPNTTNFFLQAHGRIEGTIVLIDFYFYDFDSDPHFILEHWNQFGKVEDEDSILKLPKALIFPLKKEKFSDLEINIPCHSEVICEYLYGRSWRIPLNYGTEYSAVCQGGKLINFKIPRSKYFRFLEKIIRKLIRRLIL